MKEKERKERKIKEPFLITRPIDWFMAGILLKTTMIIALFSFGLGGIL